ncbi:probable G-protein coupled receptor 139 [Scyliorhinus canicula]|uniref:probable G-protein coupled receptor 139 n=1 Tax=Scyliorhinus canicula TaxID=7830 RepID=UPI0018F6B5B3|nr:probable G-protein coupled receptor 139 [Scyliorhinus canicula]
MAVPIILQILFGFYHFLAVVTVPANLVTIVILSRGKCGLGKGVSMYLVSMATADLLVVLFSMVLPTLIPKYVRVPFFFYTAVCSSNAVLGYAAIDCSVWLTIAFTIDRFVAICCHNLKARYCTQKTAMAVIATVSLVNILRNVPFYFKHQPRGTLGGVPWGCATRPDFFNLPGWVAFFWLHHLLNPLIPYLLILLFNALTVRHIVLANRARRGLRASSQEEKREDTEMANRRKSIILLFVVSGSFILLWMTKISVFLLMEISNQHFYPSYNHPIIIADVTGSMLFYLSSCTNTTIYALTQRKVREELKRAVKYPLILIMELVSSFK